MKRYELEEKVMCDLDRLNQVFLNLEGTGLGLYLSQKIVKEHGGKLLVNSQPGNGAEFVVQLPVS